MLKEVATIVAAAARITKIVAGQDGSRDIVIQLRKGRNLMETGAKLR